MRLRPLLLILCALPVAALAAPADELAKTKAALKASQEKQAKIVVDQEKVEAELADLQEKLVKSAAQLQANEAQLDDVQKKLKDLEKQQADKEKEFAAKKQKLDGLSRMAIRLSRTPPQAMVLMPTDGKNRIQASRALKLISAEMKMQADAIEKDMENLKILQAKTEEERVKVEKIRAANKEEKKSFEAALKNRKQLQGRLAASRTQEENKARELAKKAKSLEELMVSLEKESRKFQKGKEVTSDGGISGQAGRLRSFKDAKGKIRIPASGRVITGYGEKDETGNASKGIIIATRSSGTVVAPFDAEVAYTGTFLNYGKLVILKHGGGNYHTLLAGLGRIDVKQGDFLLEGEPIGAMDTDAKRLYVELRENNQTVNPKPWMRGL